MPARSLVLVIACACAGAGARRFPDREPLWREPEKPFSQVPAGRSGPNVLEAELVWLDEGLALRPDTRAANVNSLDEVPDSSFFVNRAGRLSAEAVARGGEAGAPLDTTGPLVVVSAKAKGVTPGFVVKDARGERFLLKLDPLGRHGLLSGAEAVSTRILWAAGYNVPDNRVIDIDPQRFVPGEGISAEVVAGVLARGARGPDGRVRALASRYLEGQILGPMPWRGRRRDDPNDRVAHEDRRELRALAYLYMWLNNPDSKLENSLDVFEPAGKGRGLVRHYLIDFGTSLGAGDEDEEGVGWWAAICPPAAGPSLAVDGPAPTPTRCDGLRARARQVAYDPLLGALAPTVDPETFEMLEPNPAFERRDGGDAAWSARLIVSFTRAQLVAAARASGWPEPVQRRLVERLRSRQRSLLRALFTRVSPLSQPRVRAGEVCADDLGRGVLSARGRSVVVEGGHVRAEGGGVCVRPSGAGYRVISLAVRAARGAPPGSPMRVHVLAEGGEVRIVGVER